MREVANALNDAKLSAQEKRSQVHEWLEAVSTADTLQNAQAARHKDTCDWILHRHAFQEWTFPVNGDGKPKFLWIHGGPGFGKTILSARLVGYLTTHMSIPVVYFFCVAEEESKREPYAILKSWIDQLVQCNEIALELTYVEYSSIKTRAPTSIELWRIFRMIAQSIQCVIVVDGFDECVAINKSSRLHMRSDRSQFLQSLTKEAESTKAQVLLVSRDNEDIRGSLIRLSYDKRFVFFELAITSSDTKDDVYSCSMQRVHDKLAKKSQSLKNELAINAARRSDGMFLWLDRVVEDLDPGENAKTLRGIIEEMPSKINEIYKKELEKLTTLKVDQKKRAVAILRWISFAIRPLTVKELAEVIAVGGDEVNDEYPEDDLPDSWKDGFVDEDYVNTFIRRSCGSLVKLRRQRADQPIASHTVHFVHFSVKEFLLGLNESNHDQSSLEAVMFPARAIEHDLLAQLCLRYLCYDVFDTNTEHSKQDDYGRYPFLLYAAQEWRFHAVFSHWHLYGKDKQDISFSEGLIRYAKRLFDPMRSNWIVWAKVFEGEQNLNEHQGSIAESDVTHVNVTRFDSNSERLADEGDKESNQEDEEGESECRIAATNPMYYAALLGLTDVVKALQSQGFKCDEPGGYFGYPLQAAVVKGREQTAKYLIQQGADMLQEGGIFNSALEAAAAIGSRTMFSMLLHHGVNGRDPRMFNRVALNYVCTHGSIDLAKLVMNEPSDLMEELECGGCPFFTAVRFGKVGLVSFLLDQGADPNTKGPGGESVLYRAVRIGSKEIAKMLLQHKAALDASDETGHMILHAAARRDDADMMRFVLNLGVDVNISTDVVEYFEGWTALHITSSEMGCAASARLLLEHGADVHASSNCGFTALHIAAANGNKEVLDLLLTHGADVDAETSNYCTSLMLSVSEGHLAVSQILLKHGASIFKTSIDGSTVLDASPDTGDEIIELLLGEQVLSKIATSSNAISNRSSGDPCQRRSCMVQQCVFRGDEDQALKLIDESEEPETQCLLDNALLAAAAFGSTPIVDTVLDKGADIETVTFNLRTSLHLAAARGHLSIVSRLITHGASIQAKEARGSEPLDLAVSYGLSRLEITKFLLQQSTPDEDHSLVIKNKLQAAFEGVWSGKFTSSSSQQGQIGWTKLTVQFDSENASERVTLWTSDAADEDGQFHVCGRLLPNGQVKFARLYEECGWLCLGQFDSETQTIQGTWGINETLRNGQFTLQKGEVIEANGSKAPPTE